MKTSVRLVAVTMALLMVTLVLASCAGSLYGTYTRQGLIANTTLKFSGSNVTITVGDAVYKGTYEINEDEITIALNEDEDDTLLESIAKEIIQELLGTQSFEKTEDGIKIGGVEYKKK